MKSMTLEDLDGLINLSRAIQSLTVTLRSLGDSTETDVRVRELVRTVFMLQDINRVNFSDRLIYQFAQAVHIQLCAKDPEYRRPDGLAYDEDMVKRAKQIKGIGGILTKALCPETVGITINRNWDQGNGYNVTPELIDSICRLLVDATTKGAVKAGKPAPRIRYTTVYFRSDLQEKLPAYFPPSADCIGPNVRLRVVGIVDSAAQKDNQVAKAHTEGMVQLILDHLASILQTQVQEINIKDDKEVRDFLNRLRYFTPYADEIKTLLRQKYGKELRYLSLVEKVIDGCVVKVH